MKKLTATSLMAVCLLGSSTFTASAGSPGIVVGIMVDQLRGDYIEHLRPYFGDNGFNRLISEGVYLTDVDFHNTVQDAPSGTAVIYTGAWPVANGIAAAEYLDPVRKKYVPTLAADPGKTNSDFSPENLKLSTIADELWISNGSLTKIYSIAGDPQAAVAAAGHIGNAAIWLDESTGRWTSPQYYGMMPAVIANKNRTNPLSSKIVSFTWRPLHQASFYPSGKTWNGSDFFYGFSGANRETYSKFKASPLFNEEVTEAAIDLLKSIHSSNTADTPGMVNIAYTLAPVSFDYDGDNRPELMDSYMRLDSQLGRLLDAIDKEYGKDNAVVFLSSTGYAQEPNIPEVDARIPSGEITLRKAESLLNSFLSANYGNADYIAIIKDGKLYFDQKEIQRKGLDIKKLRAEAKDFLLRMGGIGDAVTIDEVLHSENRKAQELALGIDVKNTPDLFLFFSPGWIVTDDNAYPPVSKTYRLSSPPTPGFILAPDLLPQTISNPVEATAIAPTITSLINIRAPNGASSKPISLTKRDKTDK